MKYILIIPFIAGICSLAMSCKEEQKLNIITLVDFSSSRDSAVQEWYRATIGNSIIQRMGQKDRLTLLPIDYCSLTASNELFRLNFGENDYTNEFAGLSEDDLKRKIHHDSASAAVINFNNAFEAVRSRRSSHIEGTDVFGGLKLAKKYARPGYRNILVIFSDMMVYTDRTMDFEDYLNTPDEIEHYLSISPEIDLKDIEIVVLTGEQKKISPEKFEALKMYWQRFFEQSGAWVLDYSSGAVSKLEECFPSK